MVRKRDVVTSYGVVKELYFDEKDLVFIVEGYEYGEPDPIEEFCEEDIEGDYFYQRYEKFDEAIQKYLELKEKGWETVRLRIEPKDRKALENMNVDFRFYSYREYGHDYCWVGIFVRVDGFCESYAKKLKKIQEIINNDK